ncbi:MAG: aminoacyl-tRNA hydrolase [Candidatus Liptonbacteria bacterium]|nr:aminoacyl-tRNA hydrolase [Candidatus Liptonbacteria bacterium]
MNSVKPLFQIRVCAGLGNPGPTYQKTYHNVGALFLAFLETQLGLAEQPTRRGKYTLVRTGEFWLIQPDAFMNESGPSVRAALRDSRAQPSQLLVVHDDADLLLGSYRLCFGRGAGGHHGVESIIAALGTKDFWRLRWGIRPAPSSAPVKNACFLTEPAGRRKKAADLVLRPLTAADHRRLYSAFEDFTDTLGSTWMVK